jgi:hypothetical protein
MALHTLRRCPFEQALHVTAFAPDLRVAPGERKARCAVIELNVGAASLGLGVAHERKTKANQ